MSVRARPLVDPRLGLSQLARQRVREGSGAVAIFVRQVRRLLQLCHEGRVGWSGVLPRQIGHRRGGLTLGHDCALNGRSALHGLRRLFKRQHHISVRMSVMLDLPTSIYRVN